MEFISKQDVIDKVFEQYPLESAAYKSGRYSLIEMFVPKVVEQTNRTISEAEAFFLVMCKLDAYKHLLENLK